MTPRRSDQKEHPRAAMQAPGACAHVDVDGRLLIYAGERWQSDAGNVRMVQFGPPLTGVLIAGARRELGPEEPRLT